MEVVVAEIPLVSSGYKLLRMFRDPAVPMDLKAPVIPWFVERREKPRSVALAKRYLAKLRRKQERR